MEFVPIDRLSEWNDVWALAAVFGLASVSWTYAFVGPLDVPLWPAFIASATFFAAGGGLQGLANGYASNLAGIVYAALTLAIVDGLLGGGLLALSVVVGAFMLLAAGAGLGVVALLAAFYLFTTLVTNVVSNNASVVLMVPVAYDAAAQLGADPFAFVLAVTFAASTAMLTPIGYQTNLMVYGPGGYRFTDFARVGAPLQLILTAVTTLGIVWLYGV